jgi:hypothetical protein
MAKPKIDVKPEPVNSVGPGSIRYKVPGNEMSFSNSAGTWLVKDGYVDLPKDHTFWVYVGCILFEA